MKGMIKIKSSDWHYRLIEYCWEINPRVFNNFCPYFWLVIASLFCVIPKFLWRNLVKRPWQWVNSLSDSKYLRWLDSLSEEELIYLSQDDWTVIQYNEELSKSGMNLSKAKKVIEKYRSDIKDRYNILWSDHFGDLEVEEYRKRVLKEEKKREEVKKLNILASFFRSITLIILTLLIIIFGYLLSDFLLVLIFLISHKEAVGVLVFFGTILGFVLLGYIIKLLANIVPTKVWRVMWFPFSWTWNHIILGIIEGVVEGFSEFGGIFKDYLGASYSDYCPGIEWKEEEK